MLRGIAHARTVAAVVVGALALDATPGQAATQQAFTAALSYATPAVAAGQGDSLTLSNLDALAAHDIVSDQAGPTGQPLFSSPLVTDGQSTPVTGVTTLAPGTYPFHCTLHSWMHGVLQVSAAPSLPAPPPVPSPPPPTVPGPADLPNPADYLPHAPPAPLRPGEEWPFYGADLANSRSGGPSAPSWNEAPSLRPVWSMRSAKGDFAGTPVESAGTLVVVSGAGAVYALDASTGAVRWERDLATVDGKAAAADGSAAIADGRVLVALAVPGSPEVASLSLADGSVQWQAIVDTDPGSDLYGSPVVWNGRVYIGTSGQNGDPPVPLKGSVVALDESTGTRLWRTYTVGDPASSADAAASNGGAVWSTPAVDPATGTLFVGTGNAYSATAAPTTDSVLALDATTGQILRHFQATAGDVFSTGSGGSPAGLDYDFGASPQLIAGPGGRALVGAGQKSGTYWALDRATLAPVWSRTIAAGSPLGGIVGSTAYDGARVYGPATPGGEAWALGASDGTPAWLSADGGPLHWSPTAVANGVVYSTDMSSVLTLREASTGAVIAKLPLGAPSWGGVSVAGGYVFAVTGTQGSSGWVVAYRVLPSGPGG